MRRRPVAKKWIRDASDILAIEEGCWFDPSAGRFVVDFIEAFCCQSKGKWAGKSLELLPWQVDFLMRLFGWRRPDGFRRFKRAYLEVAKKNGKSTMLSALVIVLLLADDDGPEIYLNAVDRDQASIIFDETARMVRASPELEARLEIIDSRKRIVHRANNGLLRANSADAMKQDGLNPSGTIFDELHRQKSRQMWEVFEHAGVARDEPLLISITTAGEDTDGVWHEQRDYSEQVAQGLVHDTTHLGVVYRADPETDDLDDPATWRKANPSMGVMIKEDDFRRAYEEAKRVPSKLSNFLRLRLNIVAGGEAKFVRPEAWKACGAMPNLEPGRRCYLGLDMSSKVDLTALVAIFPDDDDWWDIGCWFWTPEDGLDDRERRDGASYRAWARSGHLELCDGGEIEYAAVKNKILWAASEWNVLGLGGDPWNVGQLLQELQEEEGLTVLNVRQGFASLSAPTKRLEGLVACRRIRHGQHPVLAWCLSNAVKQTDDNENIRLNKRRSKKRIDGASALVNALAVAMSGGEAHVYDERPEFLSLG